MLVHLFLMPPKRSFQGRSAAQIAQLQQLSKKGKSESTLGKDEFNAGEISAESAAKQMEQQILDLEAALAEERAISTQLSKALEKCQSQRQSLASALEQSQTECHSLSDELEAQREHTHQLWRNMRVERRARQRGQARKAVLEEEIKSLKSAGMEISTKLKEVMHNASKAVDMLLRLEKEKIVLSKNLEQCTTEISLAQEKLMKAGLKMKSHQSLAARLKKRCDRAVTVKTNAVKRAMDQARKEHSIHWLLSKGCILRRHEV